MKRVPEEKWKFEPTNTNFLAHSHTNNCIESLYEIYRKYLSLMKEYGIKVVIKLA